MRTILYKWKFGVMIFLSFCTINAKEKPYHFHDLEQLAIERNFSVAATLQKRNAVSHKLALTRSKAWPQLSAYYRYTPDGIGLSEEEFNTKHLLSVRLSQDLINLIKVRGSGIKTINAEADIVESELQEIKGEALLEFRSVYLDVLADSARVKTYAELIKIYQQLQDIVQIRYKHDEELFTEVLQIEQELIETKGLFDYYQNRLSKTKRFLAEDVNLSEFEISWQAIDLSHTPITEEKLYRSIVENSYEIKRNDAYEAIEANRAKTSFYENFSFAPYFGLRLRENRFSRMTAGPEFGLRFSMPLHWIGMSRHNRAQFKAREKSWHLRTKEVSNDLKKLMAATYDEYRLLESQIVNTQKIIQLIEEQNRIDHSRSQKALNGVKDDPKARLQLQAELLKTELKNKIYHFQHDQKYYEIFFLSGFLWPEEFADFHKSEIRALNKHPKAMWLWKTQGIMQDDKSKSSLLKFCNNQRVEQLFISLDSKSIDSLKTDSLLSNFISELANNNIKVSALLGEPLWVYEDHRANLLNKVQKVVQFNAENSAKFHAIHLDIEPHTLSEWHENQNALLHKLVETINEVKTLISSNSPSLKLEIDLPTFYHKVDKNALKKLIEIADVITIMAYEQKSSQKVAKAVQFITKYADQHGRDYMIGFNAKEFESWEEIENLINEVDVDFNSKENFSGFAIHQYRDYRNLPGK